MVSAVLVKYYPVARELVRHRGYVMTLVSSSCRDQFPKLQIKQVPSFPSFFGCSGMVSVRLAWQVERHGSLNHWHGTQSTERSQFVSGQAQALHDLSFQHQMSLGAPKLWQRH
jgi:hypothetical protein